MLSGVRQSLIQNRVRLAVIAAVAAILFVGVFFVDRFFEADDEPQEEEAVLAATEVPRTPIANSETGRLVAAILEDESFQKERPENPEKRKKSVQKSVPWPSWAVALVKVILVVLAVGTVAAFIWILIVGSTGGALAQKPRKDFKSSIKKRAPIEHHMVITTASMSDVESMAENGQFGEAVRMLLSMTLTTLAGRDLVRIIPSMTGREIVTAATISASALSGLRHLVLTVEAYAFAGQDVNRELFDECLGYFKTLSLLKGAKE